MKKPVPTVSVLLSLTALWLAGCGGVEPHGPPAALEPQVAEEQAPPVEPAAVREAEFSLSDRWRSPFAVSSVGRISPPEPRAVAVLGSDPSIVPVNGEADASGGRTAEAGSAAEAATPSPAAASGAVVPSAGGAGGARAVPSPAPLTPPPAPATPPAPAAAASPTGMHEVARGDTWYGIAGRYGVAPRDLAAANPGVDPERIRIGQTLRIPNAAGATPSRSHRVGPGDTLWGIARRYDVSVEEIRRLNQMTDDRVRLNETLRIP